MNQADIDRYHHWVRTQPCIHCGGYGPVELAHYSGVSKHWFGHGRGRRVHDLLVTPLCGNRSENRCHPVFDDMSAWGPLAGLEGNKQALRFSAKVAHSELFLVYCVRTLIGAVLAGVLDVRCLFKRELG